MQALSVRAPWWWAILQGWKTVENRTRRTLHRGPLAIHAAKRGWPVERYPTGAAIPPAALATPGAIVGIVDVVDCVEVADLAGNLWAVGPWCWVLANPRQLPNPVPWVGNAGIFHVPDNLR